VVYVLTNGEMYVCYVTAIRTTCIASLELHITAVCCFDDYGRIVWFNSLGLPIQREISVQMCVEGLRDVVNFFPI